MVGTLIFGSPHAYDIASYGGGEFQSARCKRYEISSFSSPGSSSRTRKDELEGSGLYLYRVPFSCEYNPVEALAAVSPIFAEVENEDPELRCEALSIFR
jgi:hypothetical protein